MSLEIKLNQKKISKIAGYLSPKEISDYVSKHKKEYSQFLEKENEEIQKSVNIENSNTEWTQFSDDAICKVKLENQTKGGEQK